MSAQKLVSVSESRIEALKSELTTKLEQPKAKQKRVFAGFKSRLKYTSETLTVDVEVRYEKVTSKGLEQKRTIVHRAVMPDGSSKVVENKPTPYKWCYQDAEGKEVPESLVHHYELLADGAENEVAPFERTKEIEIIKTVPMSEVESFLIESQYEVWSTDNISGAWAMSQELVKKDIAAVGKLSFGRGFTEYWAIFYPVRKDGQFLIVMVLTKMRKEYKRWMSIPNGQPDTNEKCKTKKASSVLQEI